MIADERIELRPHRRLRAHVARRHGERHHLADTSWDRSRTAAPPPAGSTPRSEPHIEPARRAPPASSPALCRTRHRASSCRIFAPAQPTESAASLRDFWSGVLTMKRRDRCDRAFSSHVAVPYSDGDLWAIASQVTTIVFCASARQDAENDVGRLHMRLIGHPARAAGLERLLDYIVSG